MSSNNITLNTILGEVSSLLGDATVGSSTETTRKTLAVNMAKDFVLSQIGLPSSEITYSFLYTENVVVYPLPFGYVDKIMLRYDETKGTGDNNERSNWSRKFEYVNPQEFYPVQYRQAYDIIYWSVDYVNGTPSLLVNTRNIISKLTIDQADSTNFWTLLGDGSNLRVDNVVYTSGLGSLEFDINAVTNGYVTLQKNLTQQPSDWTVYENNGVFTFDEYFQSVTGFTGISVNFGTDLSNYWSISTTVDKNGNAPADGWTSFALSWANATMVGSPDVKNIKYFWITMTYGGTLVPTTDWRIDNMCLYNPDAMVFTFYTDQVINSKGTGTMTNVFSDPNDVATFLSMDQSVKNGIEYFAAMMYRPQAEGMDNSWLQQMATTTLATLKVRYPKKLVNYLFRLRVSRNHGSGRHGK